MVAELFRKVQDNYIQQRELGWRGKGLRQQPSTVAAHFQLSLTELTTRLERYTDSHSLTILVVMDTKDGVLLNLGYNFKNLK